MGTKLYCVLHDHTLSALARLCKAGETESILPAVMQPPFAETKYLILRRVGRRFWAGTSPLCPFDGCVAQKFSRPWFAMLQNCAYMVRLGEEKVGVERDYFE